MKEGTHTQRSWGGGRLSATDPALPVPTFSLPLVLPHMTTENTH